MRLALLITGLLVLKPSPDAPDKDLYTGIGLGSHRSPKTYYHNSPFIQIIFLEKEELPDLHCSLRPLQNAPFCPIPASPIIGIYQQAQILILKILNVFLPAP